MAADNMQINTAQWQTGVYFVQLSDGQENVVERLILEKL